MALLRQRGGGLLATGPDAVRVNAMREQQRLLGAARAPSVISAPRPILEENPLNSLGQGLSKIGGFLGDMSARKKREDALAAALAPIQTSSMQTVQPAGFFIKDGIEIDPSKSMLPNDLNQAFLREAIQTNNVPDIERLTGAKFREAVQDRVTSKRNPTLEEQAMRLFRAGFPQEAQNLLGAIKVKTALADREISRETLRREKELRDDIAEALASNDMRRVAALQMMSSEPSIMQAGAQLAKTLGEPPKTKKPFDGSDRAARDELEDVTQVRELASLNTRLDSVMDDIASGDLEFGLVEDSFNFVRNFTGFALGEKGARKMIAKNKYERFIQKYVNDSLRLNKGVQTEGDAMRAIRELRAARDVRAVEAALSSLEEINNRAQDIRKARVQDRRALYGMKQFNFGDNVSFKEVD
jgi:hypothetical protein